MPTRARFGQRPAGCRTARGDGPDGIHVNIRLAEHKLRLLVLIGVRTDGRKELVALADGYRESTESWADLLRDCARRGMQAPVLAVGDGALGFWGALREALARSGSCGRYLTGLAEVADERAAELAEQLAEEAPAWITDALGPAPEARSG
jgi:mutator family transposase